MTRNFPCPDTEEPCERSGCTLHNCQLEYEANVRAAQTPLSPEEEEIRRLALPVARDIAYEILRAKGLHTNRELVDAWSKNRRIIEAARRRVREERGALKDLDFDF